MDPAYSTNAAAGTAGHALSLPTSLKSQLITLGITPVPDDPRRILQEYLDVLPMTVLTQLGELVPPRERSKIPQIRQRRHIWAHGGGTSSSSSAPSAPSAPSSFAPSAPFSSEGGPSGSTRGPNGGREALPGRTGANLPLDAAGPSGGLGGLSGGGQKPIELTAPEARIRWPLLWEQLGGDPTLVEETARQRDAMSWAEHDFMPGSTLHVGRLARLMGEEEEIGVWQETARNRARERRMEMEGEEFDEESDEEDGEGMVVDREESGSGAGGAGGAGLTDETGDGSDAAVRNGARSSQGGEGGHGGANAEGNTRLNAAALDQFADYVSSSGPSHGLGQAGQNGATPAGVSSARPTAASPKPTQAEVTAQFERRVLELFLDGLDTIDYDAVDFTPVDDPIADRDRVDAYFDDEAPSTAAHDRGNGAGNGHGAGSKAMENGQGEYDY